MKQHYTIAIDGPSGAGKSTLARRLAKELGCMYVDTGAIYRTVAYHFAMLGIGPRDVDNIRRFLPDANVEIVYLDGGEQRMLLNGTDVTDELRTPEISAAASQISAQPLVRAFLLDMQRDLARRHSVVMDGRDIGTVVLPDADVKVFLTASPQARAKRRCDELLARGEHTTLAAVLADQEQRDARDRTRETAPLKKAPDAVELDTTELTIDQAAQALREIVESGCA